MKKLFISIAILAIVGGAALAGKALTIKGSDTMLILNQRWAEIYMREHPGTTIQVTGGGSGVGISALINGTTAICAASRSMTDSEKRKLRERWNTLGTEIPVARDGVTIYVHASNPVNELSFDQLKRIYTGECKNWQEVGGKNAPVVLYGRENSSGTYSFFKDNVLKGADYASQTQTMPGTAAVVNAVTQDKNGIGYGGAAYAQGVKILKIRKNTNEPAYEPTGDNVKSGRYPLSRYLFYYLKQNPTGDAKNYIDWVISSEGQKIVSEVGYFPVK
jgi:phosphate transport system substrate-binding protein